MHDSLIKGFCNYTVKLAAADDEGQWFDEKSLTRHEKNTLRSQARADAKDHLDANEKKYLMEIRALRKEKRPNDLFWTDVLTDLGTRAGGLAGVATGTAIASKVKDFTDTSGFINSRPKLRAAAQFAPMGIGFLTGAPIMLAGGVGGYNIGRKWDEDKHQAKFTPKLINAEKKYNDKYEEVYFDPDFRKRVYESMKLLGGDNVDY